MTERSIVGDLINFRGLVYAPLNEQGVVFLFGRVAHDLNMYVEEIKPGFPDCIARRFVGKGWERVRIEFEHCSSNFLAHKHDPQSCDIIVCWKHDWPNCPIEVIELSSEIRSMDNLPIEKPGNLTPEVKDAPANLEAMLKNLGAEANVGRWYEQLFNGVQSKVPEVWAKISTKYIGWYCPERAFASLLPRKSSIKVECFSRGIQLEGTNVVNLKSSPRWAKFTIKSDSDIEAGIRILTISVDRFKEAIRHAEPTSYFSGGQSGNTQDADGAKS
jgi:hypothetical protein